MTIISRDRIDAALADLLREIAAGAEYPDAQWRVSQRHRVSADALQAAYDEHGCNKEPS